MRLAVLRLMATEAATSWIALETVPGAAMHAAAEISRVVLPHLRQGIMFMDIDACFDVAPPPEAAGAVDELVALARQQRSSFLAKLLRQDPRGARLNPRDDQHFELFMILAAYSILATAWGSGPKGRMVKIYQSNDSSCPLSLLLTEAQWTEISAELNQEQLGLLQRYRKNM